MALLFSFFVQVDTDRAKQLAGAAGVRSLPTFQIFRRGVKVDELVGADSGALRSMIGAAIAASDVSTIAAAPTDDCKSVIDRVIAPRLGGAESGTGAKGAKLGAIFRKLGSLDAVLREHASTAVQRLGMSER